MDVKFIETSSSKLSELSIENGQIVALNDKPGLFYDLNNSRYQVTPQGLSELSHVGMIIHSTTLDTMEKVIAIYGGTTWVKIEGRMLLGQSSSYAINSTGGSATNTLSVANLPSHAHSVGAHSHGLNQHYHGIPSLSGSTDTAPNHIHGLGVSQGNNNSPAYNAESNNGDRFEAGSTGGAGAHYHAVVTYESNTHYGGDLNTHNSSPFNSGSAGSGTAINNMPPYKTVYIWERIA